MKYARLIVGVLVGMAVCSANAQESAGARAGNQIGQFLFGQPDNSVYMNTLLRGIEANEAIRNAQHARADAAAAEQLVQIRRQLADVWQRIGFAPDMAQAIANSFTPSDSDQAVMLSMRNESTAQAGADIRQAVAARNYQLANQLLLGALAAQQARSAAAAPDD